MLTSRPPATGPQHADASPTPLPDPTALLSWPRRTARTVLRPLEPGDVDAIAAYRIRPDVCRYLAHDPLDVEAVRARVVGRLPGTPARDGRLVRGVAILHGGKVVGDGMLRVSQEGLRIGYALHPDVWGQGLGTEVAEELAAIGTVLQLPVHADVIRGNEASRAVLVRAGFEEVDSAWPDGRHEYRLRAAAQ